MVAKEQEKRKKRVSGAREAWTNRLLFFMT
jgi:hypothetical protein